MTDEALASDPAQLVAAFRDGPTRFAAYTALQAFGSAALPAVHAGLDDADWHVRHWCAIYLDRHGAPASLPRLLPLLHDPVAKVRLWAVHTLACQHCHAPPDEIDVVPLLIERIKHDASLKVRKMAVAMLADSPPDARTAPVFREVLDRETDARIRLHATRGIANYRAAGLMPE